MSLTKSALPPHFQGGDWLPFLSKSFIQAGLVEQATVLPAASGIQTTVGIYHFPLHPCLLGIPHPHPAL